MASIKYDADYSDADVVALLLGIGLHMVCLALLQSVERWL